MALGALVTPGCAERWIFPSPLAGGRALDEYGLPGVGEAEVVGHGQDLDRPGLGTPPVVFGPVPGGRGVFPLECVERIEGVKEGGLVAQHREVGEGVTFVRVAGVLTLSGERLP